MTKMIKHGSHVRFHYTLKDDSDTIVDASTADEPAHYIQGQDPLPPGLEAALSGRTEGDSFTVDLSPSEAFGEHNGEAPRAVSIEAFSEGEAPYIGMAVVPEDQESDVLWVTQVGRGSVMLDSNHPLAGLNVSYHVEVLHIAEA